MAKLKITYGNTTIVDDRGANSTAPNIVYDGHTYSADGDHILNTDNKRAKYNMIIGNKTLNCANKRFTNNIITSYHNPFASNLNTSEKLNAVVYYTNQYYSGAINEEQLRDCITPGDTIAGVSIGAFEMYSNNYYSTAGNPYYTRDYYSEANSNVTLIVLDVCHDYLSANQKTQMIQNYGYSNLEKAAVTFIMYPYIYSGSPFLYYLDNDNRKIYGPTTANGLCYIGSISNYGGDFTNSNVGYFGWSYSSEHSRLNNTHFTYRFTNALPNEISGSLKQVTKNTMDWNSSGTFVSTVDDYAFLLSATELVGDAAVGFNEQSFQYAYFANGGNIEVGWTRSVNGHESQYYYDFNNHIMRLASPGHGGQQVGLGLGHSFCFCI